MSILEVLIEEQSWVRMILGLHSGDVEDVGSTEMRQALSLRESLTTFREILTHCKRRKLLIQIHGVSF